MPETALGGGEMVEIGVKQKHLSFGEFRLDAESQRLTRGGEEIHLAKRPFEVLQYFIEHRERVVSRDELLDKFWDGHDVYDDALRKTVGAIRKALNDLEKPPRFIETRYGSGYRFVGAVDEEPKAVGSRQSSGKANDYGQPTTDNRQTTKNENPIVHSALVNRPTLVVVFAIALISFVALGFFTFREKSRFAPLNLTEAATARRSIAVLPLVNLTGDAANDYLSDGITESLINELSRNENLKVISRSSAFQIKSKDATAQEIGERLDVETILEGNLRRGTDKIRIETRLISVKDGSVIWTSDSQEKSLGDVLAIQDAMVCQIVAGLKVKICDVPAAERYTKNTKAYQLYLQGLYYRNRLGKKDLEKAIEFYNQALQVDPNYALAHEGLAAVYLIMEEHSHVPPGTAAPQAEFHAVKALESDDSLAGAYMVLGTVKTMNNYDLAAREKYYEQALLKNPNHRTAHLWLANNFTVQGKFEQAEREILRVRELDPLSSGVQLNLAELYYYWRKPDRSIEQAELMLIGYPNDETMQNLVAKAAAQKGDFNRAFAALEKTSPDNSVRALVLGFAGRGAEGRKIIEKYAASDDGIKNPYWVACLYAVVGEKKAAFEWLEKSYAVRQADLVSMKIDPALDSLRGDARFEDLLRRVHLTD